MKTTKLTNDILLMKKNAAKAEAMLKMLANANRLMILCYLVKGELSVGQLAELIDLSQSAMSQHLAKMRELELVEAEKRGQEVFYRVASPEVTALLSTLYLIYCRN